MSQQKRRTSVIEEINAKEIKCHIYGIIYVFRTIEKRKYFTQTMVLEKLNKEIGWPVKSDMEGLELFKNLFNECTTTYYRAPGVRGGYSFQQKLNPSENFLTKILKGF